MATYAENILPNEAAYYTLVNASISGGILTLAAGGSAQFIAATSDVAALTETMRVAVSTDTYTNSYNPNVFIRVTAKPVSGDYECRTCAVTIPDDGLYTAVLNFTAGAYESLVVDIYATESAVLSLWELCPEAAEDLSVIIDGVEQSLPKLLYDYNTWPMTISQIEHTISLITCDLIQNTDVSGHFLLNFTASEASTLTLRFKDNEATELYAPLTYDIQAGRNSIGVPHAYLDRLAGYHNFVVTAQVAAGTVTVGTRGLLFTIDGGYVAERVVNIGVNIGDITIQQSAEDAAPSYVWIISVEAGEALVRRRAYDPAQSNVAFEPMYSFGDAKQVAIEFDGDWALREDADTVAYRLNTRPAPFCFWTDLSNNLFVQTGSDETTKFQLDTDVSAIAVCRGYKSNFYPAQDQGVVCLYIKNGVAYYRQYAYDAFDENYKWLAAIEITEVPGTVEAVHIHRLNDYRIAFAITTDTQNYWLISTRTYVGQASKPETAYFMPTVFSTVGLYAADNLPDMSIIGDLSDDRHMITATFNYPIRCLAWDIAEWLTIPDGLIGEDEDNIEEIDIEDNVLFIKTKYPVLAQYTVSFVDTAAWQFKFNDAWQAMPTGLSFTYDPYGHISSEPQSQGTFALNLTQFDQSVQLIPTVYTTHPHRENAEFDPTLDITLQQKLISRVNHNHEDTAQFTVHTMDATIQLILVGEQPI